MATGSESAIREALDFVTMASEEERTKNFKEALSLYEKGIDRLRQVIKYGNEDEWSKGMIIKRCDLYQSHAEAIRKHLRVRKEIDGNPVNLKAVPIRNGDEDSDSSDSSDYDEEDSKKKLEAAMSVERPNVKWSDVVGLEEAKQALTEAVILPNKFPNLFTGKRTPWKGILLFGPPGTGKSHLANAVATEVKNSKFFSVSSSDLVSKWLGGSEDLFRNLFDLARSHKPSIIFIDHIDSLCSSRSDDNWSPATKRMKTEFLVQMEGVGTQNEGVLVLGASNIPWVLDSAFMRLFEKRIYTSLPEMPVRLNMFKAYLGNVSHLLAEEDVKQLAWKTEGYSGADINVVVRDGLMQPVRKIQNATHFKRVRGPSQSDPGVIVKGLLTPCAPGAPGSIAMTCMDVPGDKLIEPPVTMSDMLKSLATCKPTVKKEDLEKMRKFASENGQQG